MNIPTYKLPYENPTDYILQNIKIGFIQPEASVNFVYNPEVFTLDGYSGTAAISLDSTAQAFGLNSLLAANMAYLETVTYTLPIGLDGNTSYTFSVYIKGISEFELSFESNFAQIGGYTKVKTTNFWDKYTHTIHLRDGVDKTNIRVVIKAILTNSTSNINFDGFQVEPKPYATTFISGSRNGHMAGIKEYFWNGNAHESASTRLSSTATGGKVITLKDMGIDLLGINGFGMPEVDNVSQQLALKQRSTYIASNYKQRSVELLLNINSANYEEYLQKRNVIIKLINPNKTRWQQPCRMFINFVNGDKNISETVYLDVNYESGLSGQYANFYNEKFALNLVAYDPYIKSLYDTTCELVPAYSDLSDRTNPVITSSNVEDEWTQINPLSVFPGEFFAAKGIIGPDGKYYVIGRFNVDGKEYLAVRWDGLEWETVGEHTVKAPSASNIFGADIVFVENKAYIVGYFNGTTGTVTDPLGTGTSIIGYNIQTNNYFSIGNFNGGVRCIATDGKILYVGGQFTEIYTTTLATVTTKSAAKYNIATNTWTSLGGFFPATAPSIPNDFYDVYYTVAIDNDGIVWFGGKFTFALDGVNAITRYNPTTDEWIATEPLAISTSPVSPLVTSTPIVYSIVISRAGDIYIGGLFDATQSTNDNPTVLNRLDRPIAVGKWDGITWQPLEALLFESDPGTVDTLTYDNTNNLLYASGNMTYAGPQYLSPYDANVDPYATYIMPHNVNGCAVYNGSTWKALPLYFDTTIPFVHITLGSFYEYSAFATTLSNQYGQYGLPPELQNSLFIITNYSTGTTYQVPAITECNNEYGDMTWPVITIVGPGTFDSIKNLTMNTEITFNDLVLTAESVVTIDLRDLTPIIIPNDIKWKLNKSSNLTSFYLLEGINNLQVFYKDVMSASKVYITYRKQYLSFDAIGKGI